MFTGDAAVINNFHQYHSQQIKSGSHLQQINLSLSYCACILLLHGNRNTGFDHEQSERRELEHWKRFSIKPTKFMRFWSENIWPVEHFMWAGCCKNERGDGQNVKRTNNFFSYTRSEVTAGTWKTKLSSDITPLRFIKVKLTIRWMK